MNVVYPKDFFKAHKKTCGGLCPLCFHGSAAYVLHLCGMAENLVKKTLMTYFTWEKLKVKVKLINIIKQKSVLLGVHLKLKITEKNKEHVREISCTCK